ncbi:MAG TPA: hypothetical protein DCS07_06940 [Bdellovibrionales bacterium]|nr:MAG: hypothetical protein A2X97_06550 [Bdellovibrionales bacterium GWA1_52_35]OGW18936.1 MAG: hypothetical protein A2072_04435 [Nitrospirae bacterium GWC1_57_7]HAR42355.1 hypothetical protein [Bdellovibrionales bacterium]HCM40849.1 hypothetical protein [Bdellovibrionales bacterium]
MAPRKKQNFKARRGRPEGGRARFDSPKHAQNKSGRKRGGDNHVRRSHGIRKLKATVEKNPKGFGFLLFDGKDQEDVFIPPRQAQALFQGDRVAVTLSGQDEILELKVLEHRFRELVGRYSPNPAGNGGWVLYERKKTRAEVYLPTFGGKRPPQNGDWLRVALTFHTSGPFPVTGAIVENYGTTLPFTADLGMIAAEYNLVEHHTAASEQQAMKLPALPAPEDMASPKRVDLRQVPFITIDGETARDFDDAVYVERDRSGFILWVAIADVSHYVQPGCAIDKDARERGTSVYFPERAFHMLPRALSENLCSLKPNEPRLAFAVKIKYDRNGVPGATELFEAVIQSRRRATYTEIFAEWELNRKNSDWEFAQHFGLFLALRKARLERGSIDFDLPEPELRVTPEGEVLSINQRPRNDAHRLIEEFMIGANEAVTRWIMERSWPFVYRVHDDPSPESLEGFRAIAATVGVRFSSKEAGSQKFMADIIRRLEGHPAQALLNMSFLRSLKQAVYSAEHGTHYGLASEAYTHFTSPIRRYPDLVVHRMLRMALQTERDRQKKPKTLVLENIEKDLAEVAEHCSYRERLATEAERESIRLKQVRAILAHLGSDFEAKVVGFSQNGIFMQIDEPYCEGMIPKDSLTDDMYEFDEEHMTFRGRRKKVLYRVGDRLTIQVVKADLERRQIELKLLPTTRQISPR